MATNIAGMFNSTEAAEYLGLDDSLIRRYCRLGRIVAKRLGRQWAISKAELDRFRKTDRPVGNPQFRG